MSNLSTTAILLEGVKSGDQQAAEQLMATYHPLLSRWAKGRLPHYCRDLAETSDLVQETLMIGLKKAGDFESKRPGSFLAYLRTILLNRIRKEMSRQKGAYRIAITQSLQHSHLQQSGHLDTLVEYDQALDKMSEEQREALLLRIEFGLSFQEIADLTQRPSANAARMFVSRSMLELAEQMS